MSKYRPYEVYDRNSAACVCIFKAISKNVYFASEFVPAGIKKFWNHPQEIGYRAFFLGWEPEK